MSICDPVGVNRVQQHWRYSLLNFSDISAINFGEYVEGGRFSVLSIEHFMVQSMLKLVQSQLTHLSSELGPGTTEMLSHPKTFTIKTMDAQLGCWLFVLVLFLWRMYWCQWNVRVCVRKWTVYFVRKGWMKILYSTYVLPLQYCVYICECMCVSVSTELMCASQMNFWLCVCRIFYLNICMPMNFE